ncbi:hypothetical protein RclHR1_07970002 [Rhizophagus clarus]|uniref:Uncharacterized protein n=1 Tax=Rhizophagus clarus TaxID=94130 RepID=A0A2Z6SDW7_9GLOM|nr:hypothetical protein RclHR1_07970002 [Rhizophagus clarus]GES98181.1 hypothetical protein GLOIN_2v1761151 [Rhizophagus clarus]
MFNFKSSQTQYSQIFENFVYEIKINIFKYVIHPLNLALTCQNWSIIVKDPYAKIEWLIVNYGKKHALSQAIKLGPTFIDMALCQVLIERRIITSKSFIQILLKFFGKYNRKLSELVEYNFGQFDSDKIYSFQQEVKPTCLLNEHCNTVWLLQCTYHILVVNGYCIPLAVRRGMRHNQSVNYVQLIRIFTAYRVNHSSWVLSKKNIKYIEDLIIQLINPPRSKSLQLYFNSDFNIRQSYKCDAIRFFKGSFSRSLTVLPLINNGGLTGTQTLRNVNQRRRNRLQRNRIRIYRRYNEETLSRIASLPFQQITNDPLINQFFNGTPFI